MNKQKFIPCKECIECRIDMFEEEPYYYCNLQPHAMYLKMKEMIKECPVNSFVG